MATIMLDRVTAPAFKAVDKLEYIKATEQKLSNGIPVYIVNAGDQELVRIEFFFEAGIKHQTKPLVASTVINNLFEGTAKYTSQQIAEKLDFYGAFFETDINQDSSTVALYSLNKHLHETLPLFFEVFANAIFPDDELRIFLQNKKSKYLVNDKKVSSLARKKFNELLFGSEHPLGYYVQLNDYDSVDKKNIKEFYENYITAQNCKIIVAGKVPQNLLSLLEKAVVFNNYSNNKTAFIPKQIKTSIQKENIVYKDDAIQSAIRIGRPLFNKTNPDFVPLIIVNTLLGGYFGSRLMSNIREDKGYTYGIGSGLITTQDLGYFFISTEVGVDVCAAAIKEIYIELDRLCSEKVSAQELELVQNYMLGIFLRSIDGPFALADKFRNILEYNMTYEYYDRYINTIKNSTPEQINMLANKYLSKKDMIELVVGKK